eukprot:gene248-13452_t
MEIVKWKFRNPHVNTRDLAERELTFCGERVVISQQPGDHINRQQNTGLVLWDACYLLGRLLESIEQRNPNTIKGKRCLDLGAGTGLLSIVAWLLGAETVVATDIGDAVELLAANIASNVGRISELPPEAREPFDVVFCSEVIYNAEGHEPLLRCLAAVTRPSSTILLSYKFRGLDETTFVENFKMNKDFKVKVMPKAMLDPEFVHETAIKVLKATRL